MREMHFSLEQFLLISGRIPSGNTISPRSIPTSNRFEQRSPLENIILKADLQLEMFRISSSVFSTRRINLDKELLEDDVSAPSSWLQCFSSFKFTTTEETDPWEHNARTCVDVMRGKYGLQSVITGPEVELELELELELVLEPEPPLCPVSYLHVVQPECSCLCGIGDIKRPSLWLRSRWAASIQSRKLMILERTSMPQLNSTSMINVNDIYHS
jgi:hypothetical protein